MKRVAFPPLNYFDTFLKNPLTVYVGPFLEPLFCPIDLYLLYGYHTVLLAVTLYLCDIVIYNKKYIILAQHSYNPSNYLSVESDKGVFCYFDEVIFGILLNYLKVRTSHQRNQ